MNQRMVQPGAITPIRSGERKFFVALFLVIFAAHLFLVTRNWSVGQLRGHEFRQTQTALSTFFIQRENNFSLAYPTPVLGKPWSIPMEFPLYEWTVVVVGKATHLPLVEAARLVTLICFYLTLPAIYLLLGLLGLPPSHRLVGLCAALTCPLYIFYSRAFLIESMALMAAVWFVVSFAQTMRTHRPAWLAVCVLSGLIASLVKVTTFLIWLAPAAAYGGYCVWLAWPRDRQRWRPLWQTLRWGAGCVVLPFGAAIWWVKFADALKAQNPAGDFLTSANMQAFNFGSWPMRLAAETWRGFFENWNHAVMPLGLMAGIALLAPTIARHLRWLAAAAAFFFLLPHLIFPRLFSWHDYYFYANALFWLIAITVVVHGLFLSRWRWLGWPVLLVVLGLQLSTYQRGFLPVQRELGNGGSQLTNLLRDMTPPDSVLIVAGDDWSSIIPYYAQRRALMVRRSETEKDWPLIDRAFANLAKEDIAALILVGKQRQNTELLRRAVTAFAIDPVLCLTYGEADIYLSTYHRSDVVQRLQGSHPFTGVVLASQPAATPLPKSTSPSGSRLKPVPESLWATTFKNINPKPTHYDFQQGLGSSPFEGFDVIGAHPDAALWITPPAQAKEIIWEFGINPAAYEKDGDRTDGVDFIIKDKRADGTGREIYRRTLDPVRVVGDRGLQSVKLPYVPIPETQLIFMTRPHNTYSYDWAYWRRIEIK